MMKFDKTFMTQEHLVSTNYQVCKYREIFDATYKWIGVC